MPEPQFVEDQPKGTGLSEANVSKSCDEKTMKRNTNMFTVGLILLIASAVGLVVFMIIKHLANTELLVIASDPIFIGLLLLIVLSAVLYFYSNSLNVKCQQTELK